MFVGVQLKAVNWEIPLGRTPIAAGFPIAVESLFIPKIVSAGEV